jgi:hypothetical protein
MSRPIVGIDPGKDGGAVVLAPDGRTALAAYRWRHSMRGWFNVRRVRRNQATPDARVSCLHSIGAAIAAELGGREAVLAVEGLFSPRPAKGKPADGKYLGQVARVIRLGEYAGQVFGPVQQYAAVTLRPSAGQWRPMVLGIAPNTESKKAEAAAILALTRVRPPLVVGLGELAKDPHVAEAACIARFGWLKKP